MKKKTQKWFVFLLAMVMMTGGISVYAQQTVQLVIDTELTDAPVMILEGRAMVPLEVLSDELAVTYHWVEEQLVMTFAETTITLTQGSATGDVEGEAVIIDHPLTMVGDTAWAPLASVARAFGHEVVWNSQNKTVEVITRTNRLYSEYVRAIAATGSLLLNGEMGDLHEAIVASGEWDTPENEAFRSVLKDIKETNGVTYVYTLIKSGGDEDPTLLISESDYPEEYGDEYEMEPQFLKAFAGESAYAVHFWEDEGTVMKSAFAPIYNTAGQVVAILGIDTEYDTMNHDANQLINAKMVAMAATGSLLLNGEMGDLHEVILASGEWDTPENETFRMYLRQIREINNVTYVYTFVWESDEEVLLISEADWPEEFGEPYDMEPQFLVAFSGIPAPAKDHIWVDDDVMKSAFAPIYNSAGEVVALLGVDAEAPELAYMPTLDQLMGQHQ